MPKTMPKARHTITGGPLKPDMQWAIAHPEKKVHLHFRTDGDPVDIHLDRMEELGDGTSFGLTGHIVSSKHKNKRFRAVYHLSDRGAERQGVIEIL